MTLTDSTKVSRYHSIIVKSLASRNDKMVHYQRGRSKYTYGSFNLSDYLTNEDADAKFDAIEQEIANTKSELEQEIESSIENALTWILV